MAEVQFLPCTPIKLLEKENKCDRNLHIHTSGRQETFLPALPVVFMVVLGNQRLGITPVFGAMRLKPNSKPGVVPAATPTEGPAVPSYGNVLHHPITFCCEPGRDKEIGLWIVKIQQKQHSEHSCVLGLLWLFKGVLFP